MQQKPGSLAKMSNTLKGSLKETQEQIIWGVLRSQKDDLLQVITALLCHRSTPPSPKSIVGDNSISMVPNNCHGNQGNLGLTGPY